MATRVDKSWLDEVFDENKGRFIEDWKSVLRFRSMSADPDREQDCHDCANWLIDHIAEIGFETRLIETSSKPLVYGERRGAEGAPVVLFYGHYDVQPVDPEAEWTTPPFEPEIRDGRLYARGADDNKGQFMSVLKAMEMLIWHDSLEPTIKILLEGEEECGSVAITEEAPGLRDLIGADVLLVCDTGMAASGAPAVVMGLRGIIHLSVRLTGPAQDLHSGTHGGLAPNPAEAMADLISSLHADDGSVAVAGFYDGVTVPSDEESRMAALGMADDSGYEAETGVPPVAGEKAFSPGVRVGFRPTLELNGIRSGYDGGGIKTIIPAVATAKLSGRLVEGQDPESCLEAIITQLEANAPEGLKLEITEKGVGGPALRLKTDSAIAATAGKVLADICGQEAVFLWCGGSVPVTSLLAEVSGGEPLLVGFGQQVDNVHAVDESYSIEQFRNGFLFAGLILQALKD